MRSDPIAVVFAGLLMLAIGTASPTSAAQTSTPSPLLMQRLATLAYHVPVLMYHRIAPPTERGNDMLQLVLSPALFDAQMRALAAKGWHAVTSATLAAAVLARRAVPAKTFVITFDDGRDDGFTHAFPILKRHGFVATFFVITGRAGGDRYLTWPEMNEMVLAGMEIGNHTVSHVDQSRYTRAQDDAQVNGAQAAILKNIGRAAVSFAYPLGVTAPNAVASVKAAGIRIAYTSLEGAKESTTNRLVVPRVRVNPTTTAAELVSLLNPYR